MKARGRHAGAAIAPAIAVAIAAMVLTPQALAQSAPQGTTAPQPQAAPTHAAAPPPVVQMPTLHATAVAPVQAAPVEAPPPAPAAPPAPAPAAATAAPPAAPASAAPAQATTPLGLRPKALELAREESDTGLGWKVVAVLALLGGGAYYLRKRVRPGLRDDGRLTIVRRTAIGMRSELVVVNVEGQRMLLGVTPNSIQSLAILDNEPPAAAAELGAGAGASVGERFAAMLQAADARPPSGPNKTAETAPEDEDALSGQARGLMALRRRG